MELKEIVAELQKEAANNPASNAAFYDFALRLRPRRLILTSALRVRLKRQGFTNFEKDDFIPLLKLLEKLELGVLVRNKNNRIVGLKDIKMTLKSIGEAALNKGEALNTFKGMTRNKYQTLDKMSSKSTLIPQAMKTDPVEIKIEFHINGQPVKIAVSKELIQSELALLLSRLQ